MFDWFPAAWVKRHTAGIAFAIIFFAGFGLYYVPKEAWPRLWMEELARPLSEALMVAGILGATVDGFLKRALIRDVGAIFIGWALPDEIRNYIREVSQTSLVNEEYRIRVRLSIDPANPNYVFADWTARWKVFNYSTGFRTYRSAHADDLHEQPDKEKVRCERSTTGQPKRWSAADLNDTKRMTEKDGVVTWTIPAIILCPTNAADRNRKPGCAVQWDYRLRLPIHYSTVLAFGNPTLGVVIEAEFPDELLFDCQGESKHATGSKTWEFEKLYMPGQVQRVRWEPVKPDSHPDNGSQIASD